MATYRFEAKIIKRSEGRSATAAAAYHAAERIEDERTGTVFDYTRYRSVLHAEIIAPAGTPDWMKDRAQLWGAVEKTERRKDSQLARDLVLSLPHELTHEQRVELVQEFVQDEFVAQGMIADVALHAPDRRGDDRNFHAHVMLTMRTLTGEGFGPKVRAWNGTDQLVQWRAHWADAVNRHLERAGHAARVDHRSNADQGLDREPEPKQGAVATEIERQGRPSHAGDDRRAAQARNEKRQAVAAELASITAEIIDIDAERAKRRAAARDQAEPEAPAHPVIVATDDGGMVAQEREALRLAALRKKLTFHEDGPDRQQDRAGEPGPSAALPADDRAKRFQEQLEQNFSKPDDRGRGRTR